MKTNRGFAVFLYYTNKINRLNNLQVSFTRLLYEEYLRWQRIDYKQQMQHSENFQDLKHMPEFDALCQELLSKFGCTFLDNTEPRRQGCIYSVLSDKSVSQIFGEKRSGDRSFMQNAFKNGNGSNIMNRCFAIMAMEYAVKTDKAEYIPCEVSVTLFNFNKGPFKTFHCFLDYKLPPGFLALAKEHSELSHEIPLFFTQSSNDYKGVLSRIKELLSLVQDSSLHDPMVFTLSNEYEQTVYAVDFLCRESKDAEFTVNVCCVEDLLIELWYFAFPGERCLTEKELQDYFLCSSYDFVRGIRCEFHEEKDVKHCARASTLRHTFHILDMLRFGDLIPREHSGYSENIDYYKTLKQGLYPIWN